MSPRLSLAAALLLLAASAFADDPDAVKFAGYHLTNRSSFTAPPGLRAPFWPIGWIHKAGVGGLPAAKAPSAIDAQMFSVTSILLANPPPLAVINGRSYGEGELIRASRAKGPDAPKLPLPANARVRVLKIEDGKVTVGTDTQTFTIPMHQPDFQEHKDDTQAQAALEADSISNSK
jgi:hypothetical protein